MSKNIVLKSKFKGGLGIENLLRKNEALLRKWLWRFPLEQDSFWCLIMKSKYGIHNNRWDSNMVVRGSHCNPWKAISNGLDTFISFTRPRVGMGNNTRFWEESWIGSTLFASLFPRLYKVSLNTNSLIAPLVSWNSSNSYSWDLSFRRDLSDREIGEFMGLMNLHWTSI